MDIRGFLKSSLIDWQGNISAVVFVGGCNLRCPFCHNSDLVLTPTALPRIADSEIFEYLTAYRQWIDGVVISGGEPTLQPDLEQWITMCKEKKIQVKLDTNGTQPDVLQKLCKKKLIDYVAMDIKTAVTATRYAAATGVPVDMQKVKRSIAFLLKGTTPYEFRTTIVPSLVTQKDCASIARTIHGASQWVWQQFRPVNTLDPALVHCTPYPDEQLQSWAKHINAKFIMLNA